MFLWYIVVCALIAIALSSLTSCGVCKPVPKDQVNIRDSVVVNYKDSLNVRDSLVLVPVPVESSQNILPEFVPSHLETSLAASDAWVDSLGLHHTLANKEKPIPVHVPVTEHIISIDTQQSQEMSHTHTEYVEVEKPLTWWQNFRIRAFWWLLGGLTLALVWIFRKPILKILAL